MTPRTAAVRTVDTRGLFVDGEGRARGHASPRPAPCPGPCIICKWLDQHEHWYMQSGNSVGVVLK